MFRCAREQLRSARQVLPVVATLLVAAGGLIGVEAPATQATSLSPTAPSWCSVHGSALGAWAPTSPPLPICGPGPAYGGTWSTVAIPGPYGALDHYSNATPGFQCVELADRYLAVADGLPAVLANGSEVVMNYHADYPKTTVIVNGTPGAVGHAPVAGNVLSLSTVPSFYDPTSGHVAVVVASHVNAAGNGTVQVAQQNVSPADYLYTLNLVSWRLVDPMEAPNAEFQYRYAEWLVVPSLHSSPSPSGSTPALLTARASAKGAATEVKQFSAIARSAADGAGQLVRSSAR